MRYLVCCLMFVAGALPRFAAADTAAPVIPKIPLPKLPIQSICSDMQGSFSALHEIVEKASHTAADAGMNAKGLGYWSGNRHFRTVEDDYIAITKLIEPALDATSNVPIWLDDVAEGPDKAAATELGTGYEKSLRMVKQYVTAAAVFERAAYGRRKKESEALGGGVYGAIASLNANNREMSADDARTILDSEDDLVADAARTLKLPEYHWHKACGKGTDPSPASAEATARPMATPTP